MSRIWSTVQLGDILTERRETPSFEAIFNGEIPIVSKIGFDTGQIQLREDGKTKTNMILIQPGDLVISGINAAKGAIAIYDKENSKPIAATIHYGAYLPDKNKVDVRYLWLFLRSRNFQEILAENVPGGIKTELKAKRFLPIPIPLPPLTKQKRIVARIDELAAKIEEAKGIRNKIKAEINPVIQSFIASLCFNNKHTSCIFGDILLEAKNGIYKPPFFWGHGIPCIRMYNIDGPTLNVNNLQSLEVTEEEFKTYGCVPGDLIFNRVNSAELVGKTGLVKEDYPKCTFESKNMRLRINLQKAIPEYAVIILNSSAVKDYYRNVLKQQCGMATLNQNHVRNIPLPLPSLEEQQQIVKYLDELQAKIDSLKKLQAQTETELNALLPSILDKAFKGEL